MDREKNVWVEILGSLYFLNELGDKFVWGRKLEENEEIEDQVFIGFQWH